MIRFATQPAKPTEDRPVRAPSPASQGGDTAPRASATMLLPELADGDGQAAAPAGKPRAGRKQKAKSATSEAAVQLDLDA